MEEEDKGEERTVFSAYNSEIKARGITMCRSHTWKILSDNELACTVCPTAVIVNKEVVEGLAKSE